MLVYVSVAYHAKADMHAETNTDTNIHTVLCYNVAYYIILHHITPHYSVVYYYVLYCAML